MNAYSPDECRNALRPICTGCKEDVDQYDDLFDAYWMDMGRCAHGRFLNCKQRGIMMSTPLGMLQAKQAAARAMQRHPMAGMARLKAMEKEN